MKKTIIILLSLLTALNIFSQDLNDPNRRVFWFDIGVYEKPDKETKVKVMYIRPLNNKIQYGKIIDYDKHLWDILAKGKGVSVGPFNDYDQAQFAMKFYFLEEAEKDSSLFSKSTTYYWYLIKLKKYKRLNSYSLKRMPARIASGDTKKFFENIKAALLLNKIVIGPFKTYEEAEEAKRIMRLEE